MTLVETIAYNPVWLLIGVPLCAFLFAFFGNLVGRKLFLIRIKRGMDEIMFEVDSLSDRLNKLNGKLSMRAQREAKAAEKDLVEQARDYLGDQGTAVSAAPSDSKAQLRRQIKGVK